MYQSEIAKIMLQLQVLKFSSISTFQQADETGQQSFTCKFAIISHRVYYTENDQE